MAVMTRLEGGGRRGHVYIHTCARVYTLATRLRLRDATLRIYQYYFLQLIYYAASRHAAARGELDGAAPNIARDCEPP